MYKKSVRAFALGLLFSASLIGVVYFFTDEHYGDTLKKAKETVEDAGFIILTQEEYYELISDESKDRISKEKGPDNEAEPSAGTEKKYP